MKLSEEQTKELLDKYEVPYVEKGKNIGTDFFGMNCPFCDDSSNHLGIHRTKGYFTCWKCKATGNLFTLLQKVADVSWNEFQRDVRIGNITEQNALQRIHNTINKEDQEEKEEEEKECVLPKFVYPISHNTESELLDQFLKTRGYTIQTCIDHGCYYGKAKEWMHRLIIPIYYNHKLVSFTGADMTRTSLLKYKTSSTKINSYLYNYDILVERRRKTMIITEGIFDAWRIGEDAVCTFGTHITRNQKQLILALSLQQLIIAWDGDAYWKARETIKEFQPFVPKIKIVRFPNNEDPDSYGKHYGTYELRKLIKETSII